MKKRSAIQRRLDKYFSATTQNTMETNRAQNRSEPSKRRVLSMKERQRVIEWVKEFEIHNLDGMTYAEISALQQPTTGVIASESQIKYILTEMFDYTPNTKKIIQTDPYTQALLAVQKQSEETKEQLSQLRLKLADLDDMITSTRADLSKIMKDLGA